MKQELTRLARRYQAALKIHLTQGPRFGLRAAHEFGRRAAARGLETLDVARIHETALTTLATSGNNDKTRKRAEIFFSEAITPIEKTHRAARKADVRLRELHRTLGRRTAEVAVENRYLKQAIIQRKTVEQALKKSAGHYARLVKESRRLQKHLRQLTHQVLSAQEETRTKISRELHDEIAQTLLGINVRLMTLKQATTVNTVGLKKEIASTQRLVKSSVRTLSRFAREFGKQHDT